MNSIVSKKSGRRFLKSQGFSLVELLVVIGIIAIISAIIYPVFNSAREHARQVTSMTNLEKIGAALARYKQDKGTTPEVLFGYASNDATNTTSMQDALTVATAAGQAHSYFPGLYPLYINDPGVFTDPDNNDFDTSSKHTVTTAANELDPGGTGTLQATTTAYKSWLFRADAYDSSPTITGHDTIDKTTNIRRYQKSWTTLDPTNTTLTSLPDYKRQLRLPSALGDTYVTCTTWHVPQSGNKVLVLFLDGHAHSFDSSIFLATGPDVSISPVASGQSPAQFWKMKPNGP